MIRAAAFALSTALLLLCAPRAGAQSWPCPSGAGPGEVQIGTTGGSHGIATIPVCGYSGVAADDGAAAPVGEPIDPQTEATMLRLLAALQPDPAQTLRDDPDYRRLQAGAWDVFQAEDGAAPGQGCVAMWSRLDGLVAISGPDRRYDGGMLTFWSEKVPRPAQVATIEVTLRQSNYPAQTVKALNFVVPGVEYGAIALTVPTIAAAIDTMLDTESFELQVAGETVVSTGWTGGHGARDRLRACVAGRAD